jgi:hypothetical protein
MLRTWRSFWLVRPLTVAPQFADGAVNQHILTDAQISTAVSGGDVIECPHPARTFISALIRLTV